MRHAVSIMYIDCAPSPLYGKCSPPPPWVLSDRPVSAHTAHSGSHTGSLSIGKSPRGAGRLMPLRPAFAAHSTSRTHASGSEIGMCAIPACRSGACDTKSASHWLYMRTPTGSSSL